ncbi:MAG: hypothetical protein GY829_03805, partial [Gammaproteobacteria bacterium]|nr:hypothetical protein [Gammaproteobacteria bacterium]
SDQGKKCSLDLALYMSTFGINNEDKFSSDTDERYIHTWPIYFGHVSDDEISFLDLLAKYGGSELNNAIVVENETDLNVAFEEIISSLIEVNTSFVSSGISVSQFNRVVHSDQIYFSLFSPESYAQWSGNVKRYRIHDNTIFDANNNPAVDKTTDSFYKTAKSFWSTMVDGNDVDLGGVVEQLDFSMISRLVFSNITADQKGYFSASNNNLVTKENAKKSPIIWNSLLDVSSENEREDVLTWVEGLPINSDNYHNILGDPLHSKPMLLRYRDIDGAEFERLFVGTNHGFLHAFDTQNGQEQWAFIPKELLDGIKSHIEIFKPSPEKHRYGIDGTISIYVEDKNKDGYVDINSNPALTDHALLFVGMRRGGQSYYAFDITNDKEPKLLYVIDNTVSGYRNLGQSWSKPTVIKIADSSQISGYQLGLVFGGGYDINQDPSVDEPTGGAPNNNDTVGNNIFIADALTGRLIWDAQTDAVNKQAAKAGSITDMNSIPANVAVIDFEKPGYLTHLYAADTLGQVFRFDFNRNWDGNNAQSTLAQGGKLAEIQTKADGAGCKEIICNRRFYYSPDVTLVKRPNNLSFMAVSIGSGYRAHPLGLENADHFYSIRDMGVLQSEVSAESKLTGFRLFTNHDGEINNNDEVIRIENLVSIRSQLQDFSSDFTDSQEDYRLEPALELVENLNNPKAGWFLELDIGEKVLAKSLTFANKVMFTTYLPPSALDDCSLSYGSGRLYSVNIIDGTPVTDVFNRAHIHNDRYLDLHQTGIPPEPQILLMPDPMLIVGRETTNIFQKFIVSDYGEMSRIQWREIIN